MKKGQVSSLRWSGYQHEDPPTGRVVVYYSSRDSEWPIRDVTNSQWRDHTSEPSLETRRYNLHASCNQDVVSHACMSKERFLFFARGYVGNLLGLRQQLSFTGYDAIDQTLWMEGRVAIRSFEPYFINPRMPLLVGDVWHRLYSKASPSNLRHTKVVLDERETSSLVGMLCRSTNSLPAYVAEARRLAKGRPS